MGMNSAWLSIPAGNPNIERELSESDFDIRIGAYIGGDTLGQGDDRKVSPALFPNLNSGTICLAPALVARILDVGVLGKEIDTDLFLVPGSFCL